MHGLPGSNPDFWNRLDPYSYLADIKIPIQIQHGKTDPSVPVELSLHLKKELKKLNKEVEYFEYEGDDHNITRNVDTAFKRTIEFYRRNIKK